MTTDAALPDGAPRSSKEPARYLVIGETPAARRTCATLQGLGHARHLPAPTDQELASALREEEVAATAILVRDDVAALRYALALAHLDPSLPLVVTVFDRTIGMQLRSFLPQATVFSPAMLAAPSLAGPCVDAGLAATYVDQQELVEVREVGVALSEQRLPRPRSTLRSRLWAMFRLNHRHHDAGTRMLLLGMGGLGVVLTADWSWLVLVEHHGGGESLLEASRVVATVGPGPTADDGLYGVASALAMLMTIGFTAMFTAGLVDRILAPRMLGLVGSKTAPRRDHVIVVGMGQAGVRLCAHLMSLNIPVLGVERNRSAPFLPVARQLGIPVVIGDGTERTTLEQLRLTRCRALAAVGSDDLDNIAVAVAASAVSPSSRVVLRAGDHEAIAETRALLPLGVIRDVTEMAAAFTVQRLLGGQATTVVAGTGAMYLYTAGSSYLPLAVSAGDQCHHLRGGQFPGAHGEATAAGA